MVLGSVRINGKGHIQNEDVKPLVPSVIYEGESTEILKSAIKIRTTARLSCKLQQ